MEITCVIAAFRVSDQHSALVWREVRFIIEYLSFELCRKTRLVSQDVSSIPYQQSI